MRKAKLLESARSNPAGLRFRDLCRLAEAFGFRMRACRGSHRVYTRPGIRELLNFQDSGGMAKPYQVRQLLAVIDANALVMGEENG